jgi:hypothetical protein
MGEGAFVRPLCSHGRACNLPPSWESLPHLLTVCGGREPVTPQVEVRGNGAIRGEKPLGVSRRLKSPHAAPALAGGLARILGAVVQIPVLPMFDTGQELAQDRPLAFQLIRDDHPRHICQALQEFAEEFLRHFLVPPALHEDLEPMAILIDGPPQIVPFAVDGEKDFVQVPLVTRPGMPAAQLIGIGLPELPAPVAYCPISQDDAVCGHQLFGIPVTQAEAEIQPDTVADDLGREPMALIGIGCW